MKKWHNYIFIWFLGIDGSGKTTQALALKSQLEARGYKCAYVHLAGPPLLKYFFPGCYLFLRRFSPKIILDQKEEGLGQEDNPKEDPFVMFVWLIASLLDSWIENFRLYLTVKRKSVVIQDRIFFQKIIDYLGLCPGWVAQSYLRLFPRGDLVYYLDLEPELALQRKREDDYGFLSIQKKAHARLLHFLKNKYLIINAGDSTSNIHDIILKHTLGFLDAKK